MKTLKILATYSSSEGDGEGYYKWIFLKMIWLRTGKSSVKIYLSSIVGVGRNGLLTDPIISNETQGKSSVPQNIHGKYT